MKMVKMRSYNGIIENFRFLILEVRKQMEDTLKALKEPSDSRLIKKILNRDDYIDNMKSVIESKVNTYLMRSPDLDPSTVNFLRSVTVISGNLEHSADHAVNISKQLQFLKDKDFINRYAFDGLFSEIINALEMIMPSIEEKDIGKAHMICRVEAELDRSYKDIIETVLEELKTGDDTENLVTTLFIFQLLERIGDSILNIGESLMSMILGTRLKIHQYDALQETLSISEKNSIGTVPRVESVAETRSGTMIRKVNNNKDDMDPQWVIFKEGAINKIADEKRSIDAWSEIFPSLPPRILGYNSNGKRASLVMEYLFGKTLKDIIINGDMDHLARSFQIFSDQLKMVWTKTMKEGQTKAEYLNQIEDRIEDVYKVHPEFRKESYVIGDVEVKHLEDIIKIAHDVEKHLSSPFKILIHGDFNNDNIILNRKEGSMHFIDLHRSKYYDYVQDVSVFLLSNYRLPILKGEIRKRINWTNTMFLKFSMEFAKNNNDTTFQARLALGLVRSFITSTRFDLNDEFTKTMYINAVYLLEKLTEHSGSFDDFEFPEDIIIYEGL